MFITVKVVVALDGTITRDCRTFATISDAKVRFHSDLSKEIGGANNKSVVCAILGERGILILNEYWEAEVQND